MDVGLRFGVLGPVRAWRDGEEVELGSPQQRLVLAVLLLAEGSQVCLNDLIDAVWGSKAPASAQGVVRTYVHRLRKALEPAGTDISKSVIRSTGDGYQLRIPPDQCDLGVFRALLDRAEAARRAGDAGSAAGFSREALGLWQGSALAGVRGEYAQGQRQRLDELRLSALAVCWAAELDLGAHAEAATELAGLVGEYPLDERFRELLMLALYRSGRQAAALDTYRAAQARLADELGVDPGPALQSMYQRILRADPVLLTPPPRTKPARTPAPASAPAPASVVPAQLPAGLPVFVGREAELAEVSGMASGGTVVVSAIAGMAGVGKTAFAVHWARQAAGRYPDGQLYVNLRGFDPANRPTPPQQALRTLLESLGADPRKLPPDTDALAARYRTLLTGKRVLLLLDNARDAAQVRPLLPGAPGCLAIVTSRNRLTGLVAVDGAHPLSLDVLSVSEARALLARRLGPGRIAAEPKAVEEIIHRCTRLPLALAIVAARAATHATLPLTTIAAELRDSADRLDALHGGDTAADVRAVFSCSYETLTPDAARVFRLLAQHPGPDISLPAATSLTGLTCSHTRRLLTELIQANLLDEHIPGRYVSHDLLRTYATELAQALDPPDQTRATHHRVLDHYLHTAHEALALTAPARTLISLAPAAAGVRAEAFADDADKATAWFTAEQAVLLATVEQAAAHHFDVHTWQLAWAMANNLHWRGLWQEHEAVHRTAMDAARRLGDQTAQAHTHRGLALATGDLGRIDEARVHAERAVELFTEAGDLPARAEGYRTLAWVAQQQGDMEAALEAAQRYLKACQDRAEHDRGTDSGRGLRATAAALNAVGWCHTQLGRHQQALDHCRQALILCQDLGYDSGAAETWDSIGYAHHHLGQYEEAAAAYRNALDLSRLGDFPRITAGALMRLGDTYLSGGHLDAARTVWTEGLDLMERLGHADAEVLRGRLQQLSESGGPPGTGTELALP